MKRFERLLWCAVTAWAVAALIPAEIWYDARDMRVDDITEGETLVLYYAGGPRRTFLGSYSVVIWNTQSREIVGEDRSGRFTYRADSQRPDPLTIEWWAPGDPRMHALPPGTYQIETCWTVHDAIWALIPGKTVCSVSNIFRVFPSALAEVRPGARP